MKKLIILFAVVSISFISCKKDTLLNDTETTSFNPENATIIKAGNFSSGSYVGNGLVKIYRKSTGEYVLGLEQMDFDVSASLVVYLSTSSRVSSNAIKIYSVKNLNGNLYHSLPSGIDFTIFKYLIIQTELSEEIVGTAELS